MEETTAIASNGISAVLVWTDLERSRAFNENKVGLKVSAETIKNSLLFECGGGSTLLIYGRGKGNSADHTQVRFWSKDVGKDVAAVGRPAGSSSRNTTWAPSRRSITS